MDKEKILLIDNYDSFSYNLYQYIGEIAEEKYAASGGYEIKVIRNDEWSVDEAAGYAPGHIIISPGPGRPADAGICEELVSKLGSRIPILGVCLGHQAICESYGATITYAVNLMHGKQSLAALDTSCPLFSGLVSEINVARYHSLVADPSTIPECLKVIAETKDGEIMAVAHNEYKVFGLQFHPESILTPAGKTILRNYFNIL